MASHKGGVLDSIKHAASAVKKSPQMIRKAFSSKKKMGESKDYSTLDNCEENGWLHSDDRIVVGVPFKIRYLGTMEIEFVPNDPSANNKLALDTMAILQSDVHSKGEDLLLTISAGRVSLTSEDGSRIVMRHSTSRIAYSTVDTSNKRLFCYVAMSCKARVALCHVFLTESPRKSYELTFTCAQAFDYNYKNWQSNKTVAKMKAQVSETGDIDPSHTRKSPLVSRRQFPAASADPTRSSPLAPTSTHLAVPDGPVRLAPAQSPPERVAEKFQPGDRVANAGPPTLDIQDEYMTVEDDDMFFSSISAARSAPHMLDIGVDPEDFNAAVRDEPPQ